MNKITETQSAQRHVDFLYKLSTASNVVHRIHQMGLDIVDLQITNESSVFSIKAPARNHKIREQAEAIGATKVQTQLWRADINFVGKKIAQVVWRDEPIKEREPCI